MNEEIVLKLRRPVELDALHELLKELVDLQGCTGCGFNGWDLTIVSNPVIRYADFTHKFADVISGVDVVPAVQRTIGR